MVAIEPGRSVRWELANASPILQRPVVTMSVETGGKATEVTLIFVNTIGRHVHLLVKALGMPRWVRDLHRKDLQGLKALSEVEPTPTANPSGGITGLAG